MRRVVFFIHIESLVRQAVAETSIGKPINNLHRNEGQKSYRARSVRDKLSRPMA